MRNKTKAKIVKQNSQSHLDTITAKEKMMGLQKPPDQEAKKKKKKLFKK